MNCVLQTFEKMPSDSAASTAKFEQIAQFHYNKRLVHCCVQIIVYSSAESVQTPCFACWQNIGLRTFIDERLLFYNGSICAVIHYVALVLLNRIKYHA